MDVLKHEEDQSILAGARVLVVLARLGFLPLDHDVAEGPVLLLLGAVGRDEGEAAMFAAVLPEALVDPGAGFEFALAVHLVACELALEGVLIPLERSEALLAVVLPSTLVDLVLRGPVVLALAVQFVFQEVSLVVTAVGVVQFAVPALLA